MMTNTALTITNPTNFNSEQIDLITRTICVGATKDELALFLMQCSRTGLDPFARQIHAVKRWDSKERREVMAIQIGIDGFRLIAERTDKYAPSREPSFTFDTNNRLVSATAYVKKYAGGVWHEVAATAFYEEYVQLNKDKAPTPLWAKMPRLMLAKCAEALALRRAFPAELSGLYTPDEMAQADNPDTPPHQATAETVSVESVPAESEQTQSAGATGREVAVAFEAKACEFGFSGGKAGLQKLCRLLLCKEDGDLIKSDYLATFALSDAVWKDAVDEYNAPPPPLALIDTAEVPAVERNHNTDAFQSEVA